MNKKAEERRSEAWHFGKLLIKSPRFVDVFSIPAGETSIDILIFQEYI